MTDGTTARPCALDIKRTDVEEQLATFRLLADRPHVQARVATLDDVSLDHIDRGEHPQVVVEVSRWPGEPEAYVNVYEWGGREALRVLADEAETLGAALIAAAEVARQATATPLPDDDEVEVS